jgi:hypothetical protein
MSGSPIDGLNGFVPILIKFIIPLLFAFVFITLVINIMKLGKSKLIFMNEAFYLDLPRFELFKPFIMVYLYLSLGFLLPSIIMYVMVPLVLTLIIILHLYWATWKFFGLSIKSYLIIIAAVLIASAITGLIFKSIITYIIIPQVGRFYNSVV